MSTSIKARNHTVDILRLLAAFAVICLHNFSGSGVWAGEQIVALCRFAVPLFFLFSGYFSAGFDRRRKLRQIFRIFILTVLSNLAYLALDLSKVTGGSFMVKMRLQELLTPLNWQNFLLFNESPFSSHLWFLGALLYCLLLDLALTPLIQRLPHSRRVISALTGLLLFGGLALYNILTRLPDVNYALYHYRNFLLFGLPFYLSGKLIRESKFAQKPLPPALYPILILICCTITLVERWLLGGWELYIGSIFLTFLLMHLALRHPLANGGKAIRLLGWLGQNATLTVYIVHIYFLDLFRGLYWAHLPWQYEPGLFHLIPIGVFLASLLVGAAVGLVKTGFAAWKEAKKGV